MKFIITYQNHRSGIAAPAKEGKKEEIEICLLIKSMFVVM